VQLEPGLHRRLSGLRKTNFRKDDMLGPVLFKHLLEGDNAEGITLKDSVRDNINCFSANRRLAQRFNRFIAGTLPSKRQIDAELQNRKLPRRSQIRNPNESHYICAATVPIQWLKLHLLPLLPTVKEGLVLQVA